MAYTFDSNGVWGHHEDGISGSNFHQVCERQGFTVSKRFECPLGIVTIHARTKTVRPWPYAYVAVVPNISGVFNWVWIDNFPGVIKFLREIGAHKQRESMPNHAQDLIDYLSDSTQFEEVLQALYERLKREEVT